jgi:transcriptional regulator with XRE-family HTH domain
VATRAGSSTDVGRALRQARQRRHVDQAEAAQVTRIPKRYLEALETNAPLETYPAPLYARAFLREYATFLGLDPEPLVERFKDHNGDGEAHLEFIPAAVPPPRRWPARVVLAISIGVLLAIAAAGILSANKGSSTGKNFGASNSAGFVPPSPPAASQHPSPPAPPPINGIQASLRLMDRSWVLAVADSQVLFSGVLEAGQDRVFKAKHDLELKLGNAGGVRLSVNGEPRLTGSLGEVIDYSITRNNGQLHVVRS